ncbi:hypothetical protein [Microbulbifer sp. VAAF005]|uniref:hypothetical protein n=1 Tax=Microbulbifer sp. VAAF005 TaxID=3034230 RepID=UPI0024AE14D9|nr:hypothetical protein [Microbulbifer sp. VAAF005]WHI46397.1 hypothetical protein P0078_22250 [Microbulbifer sp. VAAF005]
MTIKLYHQVGHNANWNIDSFQDDNIGDGLILSPVHQPINQIEKLSSETKGCSFFDPQFYLPNSQKSKLQTYDFFPEVVSGGFSTIDFSASAHESAERCIAFQLGQNFDRVIIPARFYDQMIPNYVEQQEAYTVSPFLQCLKEIDLNKPVYMTLPVTDHMIKNTSYRSMILNWVTSHPEVDGVYVFVDIERRRKQIQDIDSIFEMLRFLADLKKADLDVVIGYSNTESLLFGLVGEISVTCGTFENTRMFSIDKFLESDDSRRGPRAKMYIPGLLNWVRINEAKEIKSVSSALWADIYQPTIYGDLAMSASKEPAFNQPNLYKDYFINFSKQICELSSCSEIERYELLRSWLKSAQDFYNKIESERIDLDLHSNGDHINPWLSAINKYAREHIS